MNKRLMNKVVKQIKDAGFGFALLEKDDTVMITSGVWDDEIGIAIDYYGEFRGNLPWIHDKLEAIAKQNGCYWEWEHPEAVSLAD